jgi:hypothetical protein
VPGAAPRRSLALDPRPVRVCGMVKLELNPLSADGAATDGV